MKIKSKLFNKNTLFSKQLLFAVLLVAFCFLAMAGRSSAVPADVGGASDPTKASTSKTSKTAICKPYKKSETKDPCHFGYDAGADAASGAGANPLKGSKRNSEAKKACSKYKVKARNGACVVGFRGGYKSVSNKAAVSGASTIKLSNGAGSLSDQCGNGDNAVETKFNFGCLGDSSPEEIGAIQDLMYSFIRFISAGVGLIVAASIIYAGIQYSASQGSPEATVAAKGRIQNAIIGLVLYMFTFALIQYLVPGGLFSGSITTLPSHIVNLGLR